MRAKTSLEGMDLLVLGTSLPGLNVNDMNMDLT